MNSTNEQANDRYTSHTWEILYLIFSTQTLNDPSDLNILQRKLVEESERMQEYFPGYRAFHLDFALWKSFRSDPFPWFKIVVDLIQPLIPDSAKNAESQNQGPSEVKKEGEDLNASPLSPANQLSTTLDGSQRSAPNMEQRDLNVRSVPPPRMSEFEASQLYHQFRTLSFLDGPDENEVIPDDISEITHLSSRNSWIPDESVEPPLVERENLTMGNDDEFAAASQHAHLISGYPPTTTAESAAPLNYTQPSSQQPTYRYDYMSFLYPDPNEDPIEPGSVSEIGSSAFHSEYENETESQNLKSESIPLNSLTPEGEGHLDNGWKTVGKKGKVKKSGEKEVEGGRGGKKRRRKGRGV